MSTPTPESPSDPAARLREVYTVSRLNLEVRRVLESEFPPIWVEGEISNLARPRSGHMYFSLTDENCQVRCAMFRMHNRTLDFEPANGQQVLAQARVGLYPERGEFQLVVRYLEEAGDGALRRAFEALKRRLDGEGLFDPESKRPLPSMPRRIGVVTSPTGAAIRDVLTTIRRRFAPAEVIVYPVPVQGTAAAPAIARMLDRASARAECDVLILARGGGSLEDLWAFNEEQVARALFRCELPVVSGVGHEVDFTIADLVADARAATPTAAAEAVTPDASEWRERMASMRARLTRLAGARVKSERERVDWMFRRLQHPSRRIEDLAQRVDALAARAHRAVRGAREERVASLQTLSARLGQRHPGNVVRLHRASAGELSLRLRLAVEQTLAQRRHHVAALHRTLLAVGPQNTLDRGYAIVTRSADGSVLSDASSAAPGDKVTARLATGTIDATVDSVRADPEAG